MKTRSGFVSNSSSSSFIVERGDMIGFERLLTETQDDMLEKRGFRKTVVRSSDAVPAFYDENAWEAEEKSIRRNCVPDSPEWKALDKKEKACAKKNKLPLYTRQPLVWNWCYEVTCNQDEVSMFLVENKIPFVASVHYGHYTWLYTPELDRITIATNVGRIMETYGGLETFETKNVVKVLKASEWLEKEKSFWGKNQ